MDIREFFQKKPATTEPAVIADVTGADLEVTGVQTAADRERRARDGAIQLDTDMPAAGEHDGGGGRRRKQQKTGGLRGTAPPTAVKCELTSSAKKEFRDLEEWYLKERREQILPGDPFFAEDAPAEEEQLRVCAQRIQK